MTSGRKDTENIIHVGKVLQYWLSLTVNPNQNYPTYITNPFATKQPKTSHFEYPSISQLWESRLVMNQKIALYDFKQI